MKVRELEGVTHMSKTKAAYTNLPLDTHRDLKAKLAQEGKTIQEFLAQAVEEYLKEEK